MEIQKVMDIEPREMRAGERLSVVYRQNFVTPEGRPWFKDHLVHDEVYTEDRVIDRVVIVKVEGEFGLKTGFGALLGERQVEG